jgi:hypothetical protein
VMRGRKKRSGRYFDILPPHFILQLICISFEYSGLLLQFLWIMSRVGRSEEARGGRRKRGGRGGRGGGGRRYQQLFQYSPASHNFAEPYRRCLA